MKLKNVLLVVDDIEKSRQFYQELFGLQVITDFGGNMILTEGPQDMGVFYSENGGVRHS